MLITLKSIIGSLGKFIILILLYWLSIAKYNFLTDFFVFESLKKPISEHSIRDKILNLQEIMRFFPTLIISSLFLCYTIY